MTWIATTTVILSWALEPFFYIANLVFSIVTFTAAPFIVSARFCWHLTLLPLNILAKFEVIIKFLGTAALIGIALGVILYFTSSLVVEFLNQARQGLSVPIQQPQRRREQPPRPAGLPKTPLSLANDLIISSNDYFRNRDRTRIPRLRDLGLLASTILEEDTSQYSEDASGS